MQFLNLYSDSSSQANGNKSLQDLSNYFPIVFYKKIAIFSVIFGTHQRLNHVIVKFNQILSQMVYMALIYSQITLAKLV